VNLEEKLWNFLSNRVLLHLALDSIVSLAASDLTGIKVLLSELKSDGDTS
jgi:hypothetical protein